MCIRDSINAALKKVATIYEIKRRKIQLDTKAIHQINESHSETVGRLNELLDDSDSNKVEPKPILVNENNVLETETENTLEGLDSIFDLDEGS